MRDLRNELNMTLPQPKGAYLEEAPEEIWDDPDWTMEEKCVTAKTPILTMEKGALQANFIKEGMHLLTKEGRYRRVVSVHKKRQCKKQSMTELRVWGFRTVTVTSDHKVLMVSQNNKKEWRVAGSIGKGEFVFVPKPKKSTAFPPTDFLFDYGNGYVKQTRRSDGFFRFLGFWVGDGTNCTKEQKVNKTSNRVGVAVTDKGRKGRLWTDVYKCIVERELFIDHFMLDQRNGNLRSVLWTDGPFSRWLSREFRTFDGARCEKTIPGWFDNITLNEFKHFLQGLWDADGGGDSPFGRRNNSSITTTSRKLPQEVYRQCLLRGIACCVYKGTASLNYGGKIKKSVYFKLQFPRETYRKPIEVRSSSGTGGWAYRVAEVKKRPAKTGEYVFDFEVEEDYSFQTFGATLHNCDGERWTTQIGDKRSLLVGRNRHDKLKGVAVAGPFVNQDKRSPPLAGVACPELAGTVLDGECTECYKKDGTLDKETEERRLNGDFVGFTTWGVLMVKNVDARMYSEEERWFWARRVLQILKESGADSADQFRLTRRLPATKDNLQKMFDAGMEGVILKHLRMGIPLTQRTNPFWWKVKGDKDRTVDAFIIGVSEGKEGGSGVSGIKPVLNGKAATFTMGMLDENAKIVEVGKMAGLPDELIELGFEFFDAYKGRVVEMLASGWDGRALRWPRFVRFRSDKAPFDCLIKEQIGVRE